VNPKNNPKVKGYTGSIRFTAQFDQQLTGERQLVETFRKI
jgi:hypothetical protein